MYIYTVYIIFSPFYRNLFPCGDSMVCIIDDREDVWKFAPNLITVKKYIYFQGIGDINAPPGSREAQMAKKGTRRFFSFSFLKHLKITRWNDIVRPCLVRLGGFIAFLWLTIKSNCRDFIGQKLCPPFMQAVGHGLIYCFRVLRAGTNPKLL